MKFKIVAYDISKDSLREAVADVLKNYGFIRLQYSVFNGIIPQSKMKDLIRELEDLTKNEQASIAIFELCEKCQKNMFEILSFGETIDSEETQNNEQPKPKEEKPSSPPPPEKGKGVMVI